MSRNRRTHRLEVKLNCDELAVIEAAAAISHKTAKGANVARAIREAAIEAARRVLAPTAMRFTADEENNGETWWDAAEMAQQQPAAFERLRSSGAEVVLLPDDAADFIAWCAALPGWYDGPAHAPHPLHIQEADELCSLETLQAALKTGDPRVMSGTEYSTDLPTYGGHDPRNTAEVWSWDEKRVLVGTCADDLTIYSREDWLQQ